MKGDFSRITFDPSKQFTRVLMQQGRVQLDADWNEQSAILLHYLQTLAADLIGPFGGPEKDLGFGIETVQDAGNQLTDLKIGKGRYYVDGILCENLENEQKKDTLYFEQPNLPLDREKNKLPAPPFLVYLDVWERHVTHLEDDLIREVALGGPDTATRAQVVWQVRVTDRMPDGETRIPANVDVEASWPLWVKRWQPDNRGSLKARAKAGGETDLCTASPDARYRGPENQLYRVEIQGEERGPNGTTAALTFKWSRENGSVVFPLRELQGRMALLESLGRDEATGLKRGDWVEIMDDDTEAGAWSWSLLRVEEIDASRGSVQLVPADDDDNPRLPVYGDGEARTKHALLRRWDHRASVWSKSGPKPKGAALFVFPKNPPKPGEGWLALEDGVEIQLQPGTYRAGDYWLIPARTATGDVEWPGEPEAPEAVPPHGVEHHYAPLALRLAGATGAGPAAPKDLRKPFKSLVLLS